MNKHEFKKLHQFVFYKAIDEDIFDNIDLLPWDKMPAFKDDLNHYLNDSVLGWAIENLSNEEYKLFEEVAVDLLENKFKHEKMISNEHWNTMQEELNYKPELNY